MRCSPASPVPRPGGSLGELGQVDVLFDGVNFVLSGADGDRWHAVLVQPVGVQAAVGEHRGWLQADRFRGAFGVFHGRLIFRQIERRIGVRCFRI